MACHTIRLNIVSYMQIREGSVKTVQSEFYLLFILFISKWQAYFISYRPVSIGY